jgi:hypothetical protein
MESFLRVNRAAFPNTGLPLQTQTLQTDSQSQGWPHLNYYEDNHSSMAQSPAFTPLSSARVEGDCLADNQTDSGYASLHPVSIKYSLPNAMNRAYAPTDECENQSIYSDAGSLGPQYLQSSNLDKYIVEFAEELTAVLPRSIEREQRQCLLGVLPSLLQAFASRLVLDNPSQVHFRLMYLAHRYRL